MPVKLLTPDEAFAMRRSRLPINEELVRRLNRSIEWAVNDDGLIALMIDDITRDIIHSYAFEPGLLPHQYPTIDDVQAALRDAGWQVTRTVSQASAGSRAVLQLSRKPVVG